MTKGYVLDGVEVGAVERQPSSMTEVDEVSSKGLPLAALDVEAQRAEARPLTLRMPPWLQPYVAEACGIAAMIVIGLISNIQSSLTGDPENPTTTNNVAYAFGWGVGLMAGLLLTIDVSGGHINPAITLTQALFRGFMWRRVLGYWLAQLLGAFVAGCIVHGLYRELLDAQDSPRTWRTAALFVDRAPAWESDANAFFQEVVGAFLLLLGVAVVTDPTAAAAWQTWVKALIMNWFFVAVNGCMGMHPGYALNPARDLGVRLSCLAFGYSRDIFTDRHWYWTWGCIVGPFVGGILVTFAYDWVVRGRVELTVPALQRFVNRKRKES
ncbi:aquaporin-like protein [Cutaneotrichosporon oleaginosum]|uniref:Aquaporin-like protein n=1 Tax=Cutaneotrichosporon oleaginosum TaxID=879819 RepID=A0A0J0XLG8_9TREE|nr:aquaporin-like protein [Cutaneotrichosporon oleaginosum]KLT41931.1 aquaporin-like protein [Cutaneotrichosporon oleaginosum]TXT12531.1 hypothetical protein COLE_02941 [Cutaneotrichosporon oleaginosum]